jgi:hypothetical protein
VITVAAQSAVPWFHSAFGTMPPFYCWTYLFLSLIAVAVSFACRLPLSAASLAKFLAPFFLIAMLTPLRTVAEETDLVAASVLTGFGYLTFLALPLVELMLVLCIASKRFASPTGKLHEWKRR